jgi:hypothetical protein
VTRPGRTGAERVCTCPHEFSVPAPGCDIHARPSLREAVVALLWNSVADGEGAHAAADCPGADLCPLCLAWRALGYGRRWPGAKRAEKKLPTRAARRTP